MVAPHDEQRDSPPHNPTHSAGRTRANALGRHGWARVSLGYLSEVERGQKEASSELLASICQALDAPLSVVLREVSDRIALTEGVTIPDTVPDELVRQQGLTLR